MSAQVGANLDSCVAADASDDDGDDDEDEALSIEVLYSRITSIPLSFFWLS